MTNIEILNLYNEGNSIKKINRTFKVPHSKISYALYHIEGLYNYPDNDTIHQINNDYLNGESVLPLTIKYQISISLLYAILAKCGTPLERRRKYKLQEDFFEDIDTEEKAYWLGFLYADGYNSEQRGNIELTLADKDRGHVCAFKKAISSEHIIEDRVINGKYKASRLAFNSRKMSDDLARLGCVQNKSLVLEFPNNIKKELVNHFIRGYFDGDGSVHVNHEKKAYTFSIVGTLNFLNAIKKEMSLGDINFNKKGNSFSFCYSGRRQLMKIEDYLYRNANIYLKRKKDIFKLSHIAVSRGNSGYDEGGIKLETPPCESKGQSECEG